MYGSECVDHYVVSAVSEERNVRCDATSNDLIYNCILPDSNVNDYKFTVHSVTNGIDGTTYNGSIATDCCELYNDVIYITPMIGLSFPENVTVIEEECGLQHHITVFWEVSEYSMLWP